MIPYNYHRRSIRYKEYDYSSEGFYFITIVTHKRQFFFGNIVDGKMCLNKIGEILYNEWNNTEAMRENVRLDDYVIMPNHFHAILEITHKASDNKDRIGKLISPKKTLGTIVRGFKGAVTRQIRDMESESKDGFYFGHDEFRIFQRDYWDRIVRNEKEYLAYREYIWNNPMKWDEDRFRDSEY